MERPAVFIDTVASCINEGESEKPCYDYTDTTVTKDNWQLYETLILSVFNKHKRDDHMDVSMSEEEEDSTSGDTNNVKWILSNIELDPYERRSLILIRDRLFPSWDKYENESSF